ncbi:DUF3768 domain-containing protein [uncultured Tateyamaria sp.]|uniref:DUF3768 domain-containing protein n=1 Tax=uncultured Tateyamaria sp. TaxID=455651 RepID=UPI00263167D3|nr:DUF3768 domain-containing protein [uncultured Tateyamaria sp.]
MPDKATQIIQDANDRFRRGEPGILGQIVLTLGIAGTLEETGGAPLDVIAIVQAFDTFTEDDGPYGTHEFGSFQFAGEACFWKIDLYDNRLECGSPEATDLSKTTRVLTIMLASEY